MMAFQRFNSALIPSGKDSLRINMPFKLENLILQKNSNDDTQIQVYICIYFYLVMYQL